MPRPQGAAQGESQAFLPPDATVPLGGGRPIPPAASRAANRKNERIERRELLYTGITRARHALHLAGDAAVIETALSRHASRCSGLAQRLGQA